MNVSSIKVKLILFQRDFFVRRRRVFNNVTLLNNNNLNYLPFNDVMEILEYDILRSTAQRFSISDGSEFVFVTRIGTAKREGVAFRMDPLLTHNRQLYISLRSINRLFNVGISYHRNGTRISIRQPGRYFVTLQGDTLRMLARLLNTTVKKIQSVNKNLIEPIKSGQRVLIPMVSFNPATKNRNKLNPVKIKQEPELAPAIIASGRRLRGTPYQFGAAPFSRSRRFDCSSYTQFIFGRNGVRLPRTSRAQSVRGQLIPRNDIEPGDLIFFRRDRYSDNRVGHVGMDIGNGMMLNTYASPPGVTITRWRSPYWLRRYVSARELL